MALKKWFFALSLSVSMGFFNACINYKVARLTRSDRQIAAFYKKNNVQGEIFYLSNGATTLRVMRIGDTSLPYLIQCHGSPGSHSEYDAYTKDTAITNHFCLLQIDRPGYGYSNFGKPDTSILNQCITIKQCLQPLVLNKPVIVMGNSFGGPVAACMAALYNSQCSHLILVASAIAPGREKIFNLSYTIVKPQYKWLFPTMAYNPSVEKLSHKNSLLTIAPYLQSYTGSILMLHGTADDLIYYSNTEYAKNTFIHAKRLHIISLFNKKHPILWEEEFKVKQTTLHFIKNYK